MTQKIKTFKEYIISKYLDKDIKDKNIEIKVVKLPYYFKLYDCLKNEVGKNIHRVDRILVGRYTIEFIKKDETTNCEVHNVILYPDGGIGITERRECLRDCYSGEVLNKQYFIYINKNTKKQIEKEYKAQFKNKI